MQQRIPWLCGQWVLTGVNVPWQNGGYGTDFATVEEWGNYHTYSTEDTAAMFAALNASGVNSVRWWLFADGRGSPEFDSASGGAVTGLDASFLPSVESAVKLAQQYDIFLIFVLWDFYMLRDEDIALGEHAGGHHDLIVEASKRQSFIDNALLPLLQHPIAGTAYTVGTHPNVLGWDVINEPEWGIAESGAVSPNIGQPVTLAQMQRFVAEIASAIHQNSNQLVTVGSASIKWNSNTALGAAGNWWADADLTPFAADGYLDFYQPHYFAWMNGDEINWSYSPLFNSTADASFDKPAVIGELPANALDLGEPLGDVFDGLHANGYAGFWTWAYEDDGSGGTFGTWTDSDEAISAFNQAHPAETTINCTGNRVVYDDALAAGWEDWSWDSTVNLANGTPVKSGTASAAVSYNAAWAGFSLRTALPLSGADYDAIRFWVYGDPGGNSLQLYTQATDGGAAGPAFAFSALANSWTEIVAPLSSLGSPAAIARITVQDNSGLAQPTFYIDDLTLVTKQLPGDTYSPLAVNENASVDGFASSQFTWHDSQRQPRTVALVKNDRLDPTNHWGGFLRQLTYNLGETTRVVNGSSSTHPGFGYTVNHYPASGSSAALSYSYKGTYNAVLRGRHHAIHEFKWRLYMGASVDATVHWFFATGRDHPLWSVTFDSSPAGQDVIEADTRAPYGDLQWDGGANSEVAGVGWGDRYKFRSLHSPVTMSSGWDYSQPNTIPYVIEWTNVPDAEMGLVQTQTYLQHDAGGYWFYPNWGATDLDGPMPEDYNWTYQLNQYELPFVTTSKRMAWGSNFGAVGQTSYPAYGHDRNLVGYPYQSYTVFVVLGQHSTNPVPAQVSQIETVQNTSLSATVGSLVTSGPAGIGRSDAVTYDPPGYDHIYSTWNVRANAMNEATFSLNVTQGTLTNPIIVVHNYAAATAPQNLLIGGAVRTKDVGFFASLDPANDRLWLTLNGSFSGSTQVRLQDDAPPLDNHIYLPSILLN